MASKTVRDALEARLDAEVAVAIAAGDAPAGTPVVNSENRTPKPNEHGEFYVTFDYLDVVEDKVCFGAPGQGRFRESGTFAVSVIERRNKGIEQCVALGDAIRLSFRGQRVGDIIITAAHPIETGDEFGDGKWTRAIVPIEFEFDSVG